MNPHFEKIYPDAILPNLDEKGYAAYSCEDCIVGPNQRAIISLGVRCNIPCEYSLQIIRANTSHEAPSTNSRFATNECLRAIINDKVSMCLELVVADIDRSHLAGLINVFICNVTNNKIKISKGDHIAHLILHVRDTNTDD